jgi:hypothetical protein
MGTKVRTNFGFGTLRLPLFDKHDVASINHDLLTRLVDIFLNAGYVRFDTAYPYHDFRSEIAVRRCLTERYDRSEYELSTKMPMHLFNSRDDLERIFAEQLQKCGVEYFDRYLLHNINASNIKKAEDFDAFGFLKAKKAAGLIRDFGFSFHDSPEVLDDILTRHPVDFVLLQINYIDWEDLGIQAKRCYETARKHGVKIHVMEPLKGGNLTRIPKEAADLMRAYNPQATPASWALRFAAGLEGVETVFSGMNEVNQVEENTALMADPKPLNGEELAVLDAVVKIIRKNTAVPCTSCRYCEEGCPSNIPIADYMALYNSAKSDNAETSSASSSQYFYYLALNRTRGKASDCTECGQCADACPQHLKIPEILKDVTEIFEKNPSFPSKK